MTTIFDAIRDSQLFIVIGTSNYLNDLKDKNSDVYLQCKIAKIEKKPVFIIYVKDEINSEEKIEIERFFSSYNIIKEVEIDMKSKDSEKKLIKELAKTIKKLKE